MLKVILVIVGIILLTIAIVWLIDKFVPKKAKPFLNIALWGLIIYLGYLTFNSVYEEIEFNQLKEERFKLVIDRLIHIRDAQVAYKEVNGKYTDSYDSLVRFIDTAQVPVTQRRDVTVLDEEATRRFGGVEMYKTIVEIDTLRFYSVKDSLFRNIDYKNMMSVGIGEEGATFDLQAGNLDDIPVFEASVDKSVILFDQNKNLVEKEKQTVSVDGVNGERITVGSMNEVKTTGNWPKNYSKTE